MFASREGGMSSTRKSMRRFSGRTEIFNTRSYEYMCLSISTPLYVNHTFIKKSRYEVIYSHINKDTREYVKIRALSGILELWAIFLSLRNFNFHTMSLNKKKPTLKYFKYP